MIGDYLGQLSPAMLWALLALVLAAAELLAPGIFLIWIAIAAGLTAGLSLILPLNGPFQMLIFSVLSALAVSGGRLWYLARPVESTDPLLNDKAARLIGRSVVVSTAIVGGEGRVRVDDSSWPARGPDAPEGTRLTVLDVDGATLVVDFLAVQ